MNISIRLSKPHRWGLYAVWSILSITGIYFAYAQDWQMQEPTEWSVNTLKLHGLSAAVMLLLVGSLLSVHVRLSLHRKRNAASGLMMLSCMLILIFSGTGLYYSPEDWHENMKWLHIWIGIICLILLPAHIFIGYFLRKRTPKKKSKHRDL